MGLCGSHVPDPSSSVDGIGVQAEDFSRPAERDTGKSDTNKSTKAGSAMTE